MSATCRSCGAAIIWAVTTKNGRRIPLDAEPISLFGTFTLVRDLDETLRAVGATSEPRYRSHFATCPNAAKHRKPR